MSKMVERVARGIHLRRPNSRLTKWEDCADEYRTGTMRDAHAAIEAMREPTEGMARACLVLLWSKAGIGEETPAELWQAMIDEALK